MLYINDGHTNFYISFICILLAIQPVHAEEMDNENHHEMEHNPHGISFGQIADPTRVDRVIDIIAVDIAFSPASISVKRDETIKFRVTNQGSVLHELVLGSKEEQIAHNAEMHNMSQTEMAEHMQFNSTGISVQPGQSQEIVWTFSTDLNGVEFACHIPGHYEAGMLGLIKIY